MEFFKKYKNVVRYTVKIGALLLIFMGSMTLTGFMNGLTAYLSGFDGLFSEQAESIPENNEVEAAVESQDPAPDEDEVAVESQETVFDDDNSNSTEISLAPDFTLTDQNGNIHTLSDYKGQTVFLNFWATWCPPCRSEMPEIQKLYEEYGYNEGDLVVLGVAAPGVGQEGDLDSVKEFLSENGYTFPVAMDSLGVFTSIYSIRAYPTTFMISEDGSVYGYVEGALTEDLMHSIVEQTMEAN